MSLYILYTDRLQLRPIVSSDGEAMYRLNLNPEVIRYTGDPPFSSVEEATIFCINYPDYQKHGFGRWIVEPRSDQKVRGWCGLKKHADGSVDLGYRFFQSDWGKGYATESGKACSQYGFEQLNLKQIYGRTTINNPASIRVLQKLGMDFWKNEEEENFTWVYYRTTITKN